MSYDCDGDFKVRYNLSIDVEGNQCNMKHEVPDEISSEFQIYTFCTRVLFASPYA